jgi:Recombinase zinc beta ribbon domain
LGALLGNVQYKGMISHKGTLYPGEQQALVSSELWEEVNRKLGRKEQGPSQRGQKQQRQDALLADLLRCGRCGAGMVPTFTTKQGQRYRYYACERAKRRDCQQRPVAAQELEVSLRRHMEAILGGGCNTIAIQQSIESVTFGGEEREVCIALRDGTRSTYSLPAVHGRGARENPEAEAGRVPRISRIMALAIQLEQMVRERQAPNYASLAQAGHVSRARLSQILTLTNLAPSIQETVLLLPRRMSGQECVTEKQLRIIARQVDWDCQKKLFGSLMSRSNG